MDPNSDHMLREVYNLARENNDMLHRMRRGAFIGGLVRFIIYAVMIAAPIWFYMTYLNGAVQQMIQTMDKIEGVNTQAQNQFQGLQAAWQKFESQFSSSTSTKTH